MCASNLSFSGRNQADRLVIAGKQKKDGLVTECTRLPRVISCTLKKGKGEWGLGGGGGGHLACVRD